LKLDVQPSNSERVLRAPCAVFDNRSRHVAVATVIFVASIAYYCAFLGFGWFPEDEGVLYYQYLRVYNGQLPYRDFFTGYSPLIYYVQAAVFALFGLSINATRVFMAVVNGTTAVGLYLVARRVARPSLAWIPAALFVVMHPADAAVNVFHNSPYPSWHAVTFAVLGAWALLRALEAATPGRRSWWLVAAGWLGALSFLSKQNAGIFFLWGVSGFLASCPAPAGEGSESWWRRVLRCGYLVLLPLATWSVVREYLDVPTVVLFILPVAVLAVLGTRQTFGRAAWARLLRDAASVVVGVAAAVGPWLIYFGLAMGLGPFLRVLFFVGTDVSTNRYVAVPEPTVATALLLAPVVGAAVLIGWRGWSRAVGRWILVLCVVDLVAVAATLLWYGADVRKVLRVEYNLWQMYIGASTAVDVLCVYGTALVLVVGVAVAWRDAGSRGAAGGWAGAFLAVLWTAACSLLVYYPRMDIAHLVSAVPLAYAVGVGLLERLWVRVTAVGDAGAWWWIRRGAVATAVVGTAFVVLLKSAPRVYSQVRVVSVDGRPRLAATPQLRMHNDRVDIYMPIYLERNRLYHAAFMDLVAHLQATTAPEERIFAFPALPMVYFLSGRENATGQDYFFGDNVGVAEQLEVIRTLERERVRTVVLVNDPSDYFTLKGRDYTRTLTDYLRQQYYVDRRIGPYDVMRRYGDQPR